MEERIKKFAEEHPRRLGFNDLLQLAFIILKLCGVIDWAWGWVLAPLWVPIVAAFILAFIIIAYDETHKQNEKEAAEE